MSVCFISYRREDSAPWAGRLHDRLVASLDTSKVFFDVDSIDLGQDFRTAIASTLDECDVVLLLIGPTWLASDEHGRRRLDDESDFHRIEVTTALSSGLRVIPVLVGGASMPTASDLPPELQGLAFRNALRVDHGSFSRDVEVLERALRLIESGERTDVPPSETDALSSPPDESGRPIPSAGAASAAAAPATVPDPDRSATVLPPDAPGHASPEETSSDVQPDDSRPRVIGTPAERGISAGRRRAIAALSAVAAVVLIGITVLATRGGSDDSPFVASGTTVSAGAVTVVSAEPITTTAVTLATVTTTAVAADTTVLVASRPPAVTTTTTAEPSVFVSSGSVATTSALPTSVVLPDATAIVQQPVTQAVEILQDAGLLVLEDTSGCSNSTDPGLVRQVTLGPDLNTHILFGKSSDTIDVAAVLALERGDEVTVWTPTRRPC